MHRFFLAILMMAVSLAPAGASDFAGKEVVVPIVGRGPGALGSEWRTDLVLTHVARGIEPPAVVSLTLWQAGQPERRVELVLEPRASVTLDDLLLETFGLAEGSGMLTVSIASPYANVAARARIYNIGSTSGDYGQIVTAIPLSRLGAIQLLPALTDAAGRRTNIGVANPSATDISLAIAVYGADGEELGGFTTVVAARSVRRWNDIFGPHGLTTRDSATIRLVASAPIYAFASTVSGQSGDADFISGTAVPMEAP